MCHGACVGSEDSFQKPVPPLYCVGPGYSIQVIMDWQPLYPLSHLTGSRTFLKSCCVERRDVSKRLHKHQEMIDTMEYICKQLSPCTTMRGLHKTQRKHTLEQNVFSM